MPNFASKIFKSLRSAGAKLLNSAQQEFNTIVKAGKYDLDAKIQASPFNDGNKGTKAAADWFKQQLRSGKYKYHNSIIESGKLYYFRYPNPKTRATLDWWDANPLVLGLGHYKAGNGNLIEIGINLHHLPLKVRRQTLVKVFEMYKNKYRGQMYKDRQKEILLEWQILAQPLLIYGAAFAFRSYIPKRRLECVEIPYEDWDKAIYIPSLKYVGIDQATLEREWATYVKTKAFDDISASRLADILGNN